MAEYHTLNGAIKTSVRDDELVPGWPRDFPTKHAELVQPSPSQREKTRQIPPSIVHCIIRLHDVARKDGTQ